MNRAFTLIELLVTMGIMMVLVGILVPGVMMARRQAKVRQAGLKIQELRMALEAYVGDFGDYPPTTLKDVGLSTNKKNDGIESLVACLATTKRSGPYLDFDDPDSLANIDGDKVVDFNESHFSNRGAFELVDPWGNPYIYFHNRDYEGPEVANRYQFQGKKDFRAAPAKSEKTGNFYGFDSFQLWSAGPNGKNENGEGDDVPSWKTH